MKDFLISPPFGSYIGHRAATSVLGTFTLSQRLGKTVKVLQFALDNIRHPVPDGWRNRMELRNPGIAALDTLHEEYIYSITAIQPYDWLAIFHVLNGRDTIGHPMIDLNGRNIIGRPTIELNLGCQNVDLHPIPNAAFDRFNTIFNTIAKLPADMNMALALAERCAEHHIGAFHCGNTVKDDPGSLSGYPAKVVNLAICEEIAKRYPTIPLIGGGGIYTYTDLLDYIRAGATRFSLATVWFRPWRALSIIRQYEERYALRNPAKSPA